MGELWVLQVKIGGRWETRATNGDLAKLMLQADMYAGRALESGYEARLVPYVVDEDRAVALVPSTVVRV